MLKLKYSFVYTLLTVLIKKLDHFICQYLGIHQEKIRLHSFRVKNNNSLVVTYAIPFKRHIFKESWNDLNFQELTQSQSKINDKIGLAAGKTIAKGLVISFEEVEVDSQKTE